MTVTNVSPMDNDGAKYTFPTYEAMVLDDDNVGVDMKMASIRLFRVGEEDEPMLDAFYNLVSSFKIMKDEFNSLREVE